MATAQGGGDSKLFARVSSTSLKNLPTSMSSSVVSLGLLLLLFRARLCRALSQTSISLPTSVLSPTSSLDYINSLSTLRTSAIASRFNPLSPC